MEQDAWEDAISVGRLCKKKEVVLLLLRQVVRKVIRAVSSASLRPEETSGCLGLEAEICWRKWI